MDNKIPNKPNFSLEYARENFEMVGGDLVNKIDRGLRNKSKAGRLSGWKTNEGYMSVKIFGRKVQAHHVAYFIQTGEWPKNQIDHIDGNRTNNHISNLRVCTGSENVRNRVMSKNNVSGIIGYRFEKNISRFQVIWKENKKQRSKRFVIEQDAKSFLSEKIKTNPEAYLYLRKAVPAKPHTAFWNENGANRVKAFESKEEALKHLAEIRDVLKSKYGYTDRHFGSIP